MTKNSYEQLQDGATVWFKPPYFAFAMLGTIRKHNGKNFIYINFFGEGQCEFSPRDCGMSFYGFVISIEKEEEYEKRDIPHDCQDD